MISCKTVLTTSHLSYLFSGIVKIPKVKRSRKQGTGRTQSGKSTLRGPKAAQTQDLDEPGVCMYVCVCVHACVHRP